MSRLYRVQRVIDPTMLEVLDTEGTRSRVSLLAFDGSAPNVGEWIVAHSGYALERVDQREGDEIAAQIREGLALITSSSESELS